MEVVIIIALAGIGLSVGALISDTLIDKALDRLGVYERFWL